MVEEKMITIIVAMKSCITILTASILFACHAENKVKAIIFERKEISKNLLKIKYRYVDGNEVYIDSASVKNTIIGNDSINITINSSDPRKSFPDL